MLDAWIERGCLLSKLPDDLVGFHGVFAITGLEQVLSRTTVYLSFY